MPYSNVLVAGKLRRWEKFLDHFQLPDWENIPNFGLYMEQLTDLLKQYLDYLPPELKEEQFITAATINNYVRTKVMPGPRKKRYYREHIAYLIIILTLKGSLSIALIRKMIPMGLSIEEVEAIYRNYARQHRVITKYFTEQVRLAAAPILQREEASEIAADQPETLIAMSAIVSGFSRLLSEKLILLEGKSPEDCDLIRPQDA